MQASERETNWAGNLTYRAERVRHPASVEEVREFVAAAPAVRVLGARHSFNDVADAAELIALDALPPDVAVDRDAGTVTCAAGLTYGRLAEMLDPHGVALHNLASLPHVSVAGAIATGTHGSGDGNGNLATAVAGLEIVTSGGELVRTSRGDPDFDGLVVGLGAVGAVVRVTLEVRPAYEVRQRVFEGLPWTALLDHFDAITGAGYSVSLFTDWGVSAGQVWVKSLVTDEPEPPPGDLFGAVAATVERHPLLGSDPASCSPQLGLPGPWYAHLPHFRMGFTPSSGEELQSEYFVPRRHALAAFEAIRGIADRVRPLLLVSEVRTVAADGLWMSPHYRRDSVGIHFTWRPDQDAVERLLPSVESALAAFEARPHWGKLFHAEARTIAALYERQPDFTALIERLDPRGAFRNAWLTRHVTG